MRILQIFDKPAGGGGVRRHVEEARALWESAGHEVVWLRLLRPGEGREQGDRHGEEHTFSSSFDSWRGRMLAAPWKRLLRAIAPDVVHLHGGYTALSAPLVRILRQSWPTVGIMHDVTAFCLLGTRRFRSADVLCTRRCGWRCYASGCYAPRDLAGALRRPYHGAVRHGLQGEWRRLECLAVPSVYLRELGLSHGFAPDRVRWVPNFTKVVPGTDREPTVVDGGPPRILFVGSLLRIKGAHLLLESLACLPDQPWAADLIGDGPERAALEAAVEHYGLAGRVSLRGPLTGPVLEEAFAACRVVAMPSIVPEGFGLVGIEAMARGRPVAGFALGGAAEWLRDGETGWVAEPWSVPSLAEKLREACEQPERAAALGRAGRREVARRYSPAAYLTAMGEAHADLLRRFAGRVGTA